MKRHGKCRKWVKACGRGETFTTDHVTNHTYICTKHFVGGHGPTEEHPDPIPAVFSPVQVCTNCIYFGIIKETL